MGGWRGSGVSPPREARGLCWWGNCLCGEGPTQLHGSLSWGPGLAPWPPPPFLPRWLLFHFPALSLPAFPSPWITVLKIPTSTRDRGLAAGFWCHHSLGLWFGETTSLRPGCLPLMFLGSLCPALGSCALTQALQHPRLPTGPWENPCQVLGLPSLAGPWHWEGLTSGARATMEPFSCQGSSRAYLRGTRVG